MCCLPCLPCFLGLAPAARPSSESPPGPIWSIADLTHKSRAQWAASTRIESYKFIWYYTMPLCHSLFFVNLSTTRFILPPCLPLRFSQHSQIAVSGSSGPPCCRPLLPLHPRRQVLPVQPDSWRTQATWRTWEHDEHALHPESLPVSCFTNDTSKTSRIVNGHILRPYLHLVSYWRYLFKSIGNTIQYYNIWYNLL